MREKAQAAGALTVLSGTEVLDITTVPDPPGWRAGPLGRHHPPARSGCDNVVICCGVWSPRVARLAGARLALTPIVHQMISVGPIALFAGTTGEISYPIVRDVDNGMYERQHGGDMEVGSYAHRPILVWPDDIPSNEAAVLSPTELPFTQDDFDPQLEQALELMPELLGDEKAGHPVRHQRPDLDDPGRAPTARRGPRGQGPVVGGGELDQGRPRLRSRSRRADVRQGHDGRRARGGRGAVLPGVPDRRQRAGPGRRVLQQDVRHRPPARAVRVHPADAGQPAARADHGARRGVLRDRPLGAAPVVREQRAAAGASTPGGCWSGPPNGSPAGGHPSSTPSTWRCGRAPGWWTCPRSRSSTSPGPARWPALQNLAVAQLDVPAGKVVYTSFLNEAGGIVADLTIMRLCSQAFRVVTGAADGARDAKWISDHLPGRRRAHRRHLRLGHDRPVGAARRRGHLGRGPR